MPQPAGKWRRAMRPGVTRLCVTGGTLEDPRTHRHDTDLTRARKTL